MFITNMSGEQECIVRIIHYELFTVYSTRGDELLYVSGECILTEETLRIFTSFT